jgi:serine/threonine-protein kinase RsbW
MVVTDQVDLETVINEVLDKQRSSMVQDAYKKQAMLSIPLEVDKDGLIRRRVTELAQSMPFSRQQIDDIRLAVGEAVSNAIKYGCPNGENSCLEVNCVGDHEKLVIMVHNPGDPFDPDAVPIPDPENLQEGGMGIFFMRVSMDEVEYHFDKTGTIVKMTKYIRHGILDQRF